MSTTKTIGGERLGSGKKMTVDLKSYDRSTHNLSYLWRSTMAPGTLVPFMSEVGLPGDTFDIDLNSIGNTHPTIGPLFGSYKIQLDVFTAPVRLYQAELHNNALGIGMNMKNIKLPQITMQASDIDLNRPIDNQQINPSCIFSYLNIRGLGRNMAGGDLIRSFNAIPYLAYWDIYKNYYANKQEEIGAVIHNPIQEINKTITTVSAQITNLPNPPTNVTITFNTTETTVLIANTAYIKKQTADYIQFSFTGLRTNPDDLILITNKGRVTLKDSFKVIYETSPGKITLWEAYQDITIYGWTYRDGNDIIDNEPKVHTFPLTNIDDMRNELLANIGNPTVFHITQESQEPYNLPLKGTNGGEWTKLSSQEGLAIKTYQSDLFNNWMSTEWIDGDNGINAITAIDVSGGELKIDTLQLAKKVYDMLNRIAISGGSYDDWQEAVYSHSRQRMITSPVYMGGLIREMGFEEVISNAESEDQPLGTLAGRGVMTGSQKGGKVTIKVDEPSYIIGIVSITPKVDYSQGNKWDVNLETMDDFHKPALDQIGFQDLITDQMAWFDTMIMDDGAVKTYKSAGKQPAWVNYMTNVNQVRGNFAIGDTNQVGEMFMTLNRRYEHDEVTGEIKDLTTYIDPVKFNHIFAQTSRDAQNFWMQISVNITARRKMSAKIMPNL